MFDLQWFIDYVKELKTNSFAPAHCAVLTEDFIELVERAAAHHAASESEQFCKAKWEEAILTLESLLETERNRNESNLTVKRNMQNRLNELGSKLYASEIALTTEKVVCKSAINSAEIKEHQIKALISKLKDLGMDDAAIGEVTDKAANDYVLSKRPAVASKAFEAPYGKGEAAVEAFKLMYGSDLMVTLFPSFDLSIEGDLTIVGNISIPKAAVCNRHK